MDDKATFDLPLRKQLTYGTATPPVDFLQLESSIDTTGPSTSTFTQKFYAHAKHVLQ